jgi:hypothetical protein
MNAPKFTIVYKTYKNDLKWLEYSLLSLKKYLDATSILEIIIYSHDIVSHEVSKILEKMTFQSYVNTRVIPVHYDYHGYIKQMTVKANCYKDVQTTHVMILDSDCILYKKLNCEAVLQDNKIDWYYISKQYEKNNEAFTVWKKAVEDSTRQPFNSYYMANGFPFVFTRQSLENAANKFKQLHGCDYDAYCYNRCHNKINPNARIIDVFPLLATIFEEFEYLGYYCQNFEKEFYNFILIRTGNEKSNSNSYSNYFKQYWSHGGLTKETINEIRKILL